MSFEKYPAQLYTADWIYGMSRIVSTAVKCFQRVWMGKSVSHVDRVWRWRARTVPVTKADSSRVNHVVAVELLSLMCRWPVLGAHFNWIQILRYFEEMFFQIVIWTEVRFS